MKKTAPAAVEVDPLEELLKERNFKFDFDLTEGQAEAFKSSPDSGLGGSDESKRKLMLALLKGQLPWEQATPRQREWAAYITRNRAGRALPTLAGII